ncbi:MAG: pyridoxamine 5'-phosphate oxidase family protein [Candidatus Omnitrophica bacterium]|nr:pyridoxamine 5'-phosphate oxidase family protein [Candidatus Omnitrophota bacterium]
MKKLPEEIVQFFQKQRFVVVSTVDTSGMPHNSCKGIVDIDQKGRIFLLDLYRGKTLANLWYNPSISITAVDEHRFIGYCLKGKVKIVDKKDLNPRIVKAWEKRIANRITHRLIRNIHDEDSKGHKRHPESLLPNPEYMIAMDVSDVISLTPSHIR